MINDKQLSILEGLGYENDVEGFESYILKLREKAAEGNPIVTDSVYDMYYNILKELKPDSMVFTENWELEDNEAGEYDEYLKRYGMRSINTINSIEQLNDFVADIKRRGIEKLDYMASCKLNGHAARAVYKDGELVEATTRGRRTNGVGRSILEHARVILPQYVAEFSGLGLVEIRFEVIIKLETFNKVRDIVKTPVSAITSFIRESASIDEMKLLDAVCYQIYCDELDFDTVTSKYEFLQSCGFKIPKYVNIRSVPIAAFSKFISKVISIFENYKENGELIYDTDGIVVTVDNQELLDDMGTHEKGLLGNFALKMGEVWGSKIYSATIEDVEWVYGKKNITPKAIIDGTVTENGATVRTVPLYNIGVMARYGYYPGEEVFFKFGGEQGVTLVTPTGESISKQ